MFDLERAIAEWRRQMLAAGLKSPVPLEELENHLRDDVEQKIRSGFSSSEAFAIAIRQMGGANDLKLEFKKNRLTERERMKQTMIILAALFGTVFGGAMTLPALGRWHHTGILIWPPLVMGPALVVIAGVITLYQLKRSRAARFRNWISAAIIAAGVFYVVPLIQAFLFRKVDLPGWIFCAFLAVASAVFFGACYRCSRNVPTVRTHEK